MGRERATFAPANGLNVSSKIMVQDLAPLIVFELAETQPIVLTGERLLAAEAMQLLMRVDRDILEARAQWNQDSFRRLMRVRPKAVSRLRRRWAKLDPAPAIPLGSLRRRYHANLAKYLYHQA